MKERTILALAVIALLLVGIGFWVANQVHFLPALASSRAVQVDRLFRVMLGIATVIFLIVELALVYAVLRFRRRRGDEGDAVPYQGSNTLELIWTLIPAIIVFGIGFGSYRVLTEIERPAENPLVVEVIGRQFVWEFRYPAAGISTSELHLPVNQPVRFEIMSKDVIHSFWIPNFLAKRDATPGQISQLVLTPTEIGRYPVRCAELCGPGHAVMAAEVVVESQADFEAWLEAQLAPPASAAEQARSLFANYGCGACHIHSDAGGSGVLGPSLDLLPDVAGSRIPGMDAAAYVQQSIRQPDAFIVPGFQAGLMPASLGAQMSDEEIQVLASYLLGDQ